MPMRKDYVQIDPRDNIIVAIADLEKGREITIANTQLILCEKIPAKHKFSLKEFQVGDSITMYGVVVGKATQNIPVGSRITVQNVVHSSSKAKMNSVDVQWEAPDISKFKNSTFNGYHRADGSVGTRNFWLVIPLTFCENRNVDILEATLSEKLGYQTNKDFIVDLDILIDQYKSGAATQELEKSSLIIPKEQYSKNRVFKNVDGIKFLKHDGGCGGTREDAEILCNLLAGYLTNPNVAGATILSLGCQNAQIKMMQTAISRKNPSFSKPIFYLEQQQIKNERDLIEQAVKKTFLGLMEVDKIQRKPAPLSKITLGLECGGSDGFSGITANPALGYASDILVALGGTPVLAEFPELNGVEQNLVDRCSKKEDAEKFLGLMAEYGKAAIRVGSGFENNPSPGNIKDGLITDAMKSAGAAKKGGTSPVVDVLDYAEQIKTNGLNLLCTPGNDVESTTGLAGSGCNMIVFTTGLGTPTGNPIAPVLKLSSNTSLYESMNDITDLNAGSILNDGETIESMGEKIVEHIIEVANGEQLTKAEINGQNDFIPWKRGISL